MTGPSTGRQAKGWLTIGRLTGDKIALLVALLVLAAAAGIALRRNGSGPAEGAGDQAAGHAGTDPLTEIHRQIEQNPRDSGAWKALGEEYFAREDFASAVRAFERAARISPSRAVLWSSLGEARVMASKRDPLPPEAVADFQRAQAVDPKDPRSRYFLAVKKDIEGDHKGAIADWLALLADSPPTAPWTSDLKRTIEQVGRINRLEVAARMAAAERIARSKIGPVAQMPGPSPQEVAAAAAMPPSQQRSMAEAMVARLEMRLRSQPGNVSGWVMLMRSRVNLGQPDRARSALRDALAANPAQADQLRLAARQLGIDS